MTRPQAPALPASTAERVCGWLAAAAGNDGRPTSFRPIGNEWDCRDAIVEYVRSNGAECRCVDWHGSRTFEIKATRRKA